MIDSIRLTLILIAVALAAVAGATAVAAPSAELTKVLGQLRDSSEEWRREEAAFHSARSLGKLSKSEFEDYAGFIAGLRLRVLRQCESARRLGGEDALKNYDCISLNRSQRAGLAVTPAGNVQTREEKKQALEARLNAVEAEIDESLLKRQQEIRQKARNKSAASASASGGGGAGGPAGARGQKGSQAGSRGRATDRRPRAGKGKPVQGDGTSTLPRGPAGEESDRRAAKRVENVESGSDDDIIARQLREAAEKETDPILKKKLWEEYRKYKGLQQ